MRMARFMKLPRMWLSRVAIASLGLGLFVGLWAGYWAACLSIFGYKFTETIVAHHENLNTMKGASAGPLSTVKMEDEFGRTWERMDVYGLGLLPVGAQRIWYVAANKREIIPDPPAARGEWWCVWGLPIVALIWMVGNGTILVLLRTSSPKVAVSRAIFVSLILLMGVVGLPALEKSMDIRRVVQLTGYEKWHPETGAKPKTSGLDS
jgi:hypothetical protein